ncbi:MAG: glycosyltransferase family 9 protein, partial [Thiobacillaceae bacterium]
PHPVFHPAAEQIEGVKALRDEYGLEDDRYVVLLPGSHAAGQLKRWGVEHFTELAHLLHAQGVKKIVLIGGPDEVEDCVQIETAGDFVVNLNGKLALLQIAPLCEGAMAIIGNDTGTAHFASAAGRPLLVLCGPTDPRRVKPIGDSTLAVQADLPCISCYAKVCRNPNYHACMKAIRPEWVASTLPSIIAGDFKPGQSFENGLRSF